MIAAASRDIATIGAEEHRLTVLMFTDLVNSSGLKVTMGDVGYVTKIAKAPQ